LTQSLGQPCELYLSGSQKHQKRAQGRDEQGLPGQQGARFRFKAGASDTIGPIYSGILKIYENFYPLFWQLTLNNHSP
jgi:hypothetical protein